MTDLDKRELRIQILQCRTLELTQEIIALSKCNEGVQPGFDAVLNAMIVSKKSVLTKLIKELDYLQNQ